MNTKPARSLLCILTLFSSGPHLLAHGPGKDSDFEGRRVLFIGMDGCRADAIAAAMEKGLAPQLKALAADPQGLHSRQVYAGGELGQVTHQPTVSGPGWSSLLTGVWMDKHRVKDNRFFGARFQAHGHFMRHIKNVKPTSWCASFADWKPIHDMIADGSRVNGQEFLDVKFTLESHAEQYVAHDESMRDQALQTLRTQNPDVMFVYFGQVDEVGHAASDKRGSFSPDNEWYLKAISAVDAHIGSLLEAMRARPQFNEEDWLVIITTDHGGTGTNHGGDTDEERKIWLIAHGKELPKDRLLNTPVPQTAIVPLIYDHLKISAPLPTEP